MQLFRHIAELPPELRRGAVTIGNFDGVHRGHARIVERLLAKARTVDGAAIVFTFDPHPVRLLRPAEAPPPLTWTERKATLLRRLGVDGIVAYPTDEALLQLSAEDFFQQIVVGQLAARAIVEGPNFYFGHGRSGNIELLGQLAARQQIELEVVQPVMVDDQVVSSSRVRRLVAEGAVDRATKLLTEPYRIRGMVTHGARRGGQIGFPTANVEAIDTLLPAEGVYVGRAYTGGNRWPAAINIGPNPTFGESALKVEVHLIGFDGELYAQPLEVDFLRRLRGTQPFDSVDQLKEQLARDVAAARTIAESQRD